MKDANKAKGQALGMPLERPRGNTEAGHRKLKLMCYDLCVLGFVTVMVLRVFPRGSVTLSWAEAGMQFALAAVCLMASRYVFNVYSQVWRYSRTNSLCVCRVPGACGASHVLPHGRHGFHGLYGLYGAAVFVYLAL